MGVVNLNICIYAHEGFPGGSPGKESACNAGDLGSTPGLGRSPGEGHGNLLQYSCLENPIGRGATAHRVTKSQTQLKWVCMHIYTHEHIGALQVAQLMKNDEVRHREAWHAAVRGVAKSRTRLGNWTTTTKTYHKLDHGSPFCRLPVDSGEQYKECGNVERTSVCFLLLPANKLLYTFSPIFNSLQIAAQVHTKTGKKIIGSTKFKRVENMRTKKIVQINMGHVNWLEGIQKKENKCFCSICQWQPGR